MSRASKVLPIIPALSGIAELMAMLEYRRPAWSHTETKWINRFLLPLGLEEDAYGNLYKRIGTAPVLYSCHTDTAHHAGGKQTISLLNGTIAQCDAKSNCLGADDTAGAWLMVEMIRAGKPGLYIFHRAEEVGGLGSSYIAKHTPGLLADILYAIAFDRRGNTSIITHQGNRTCSDVFAKSLGRALAMGHVPDSGGLFTDTANYTDLIGECTNVSVGYQNEHTKRETLDAEYLLALRDAVLALDVTGLVAERQPGDVDPDDYSFNWQDELDADQEPRGHTSQPLASLLRDHYDEVADWLEDYGITADEVATAIYMRGGVIRTR
jgi:hypothetical protein